MTTFTTEDRIKAQEIEPIPFMGHVDINKTPEVEKSPKGLFYQILQKEIDERKSND